MGPAPDRLGAILLVALLALSLGGFAFTRALRAQDDVVYDVSVTDRFSPGEVANIEFSTTERDERVDVLIIDESDEVVSTLQLAGPLAAATHRFEWDGRVDDGSTAEPGVYRLRVLLGEAGRDVAPPGDIELTEEDGA